MKSVDILGRYTVYEDGTIFSIKRKIYMRPRLKNGYLSVRLSLDGESRVLQLHRIVYQSFNYKICRLSDFGHSPITGASSLVVHHKDCNPLNNQLNNLDLITHRENILIRAPKDRLYPVNIFKSSRKTTVGGKVYQYQRYIAQKMVKGKIYSVSSTVKADGLVELLNKKISAGGDSIC